MTALAPAPLAEAVARPAPCHQDGKVLPGRCNPAPEPAVAALAA